MQCKDKFLLQSVVAEDGTTAKDITPEMVPNFVESLCTVNFLPSFNWTLCDE